MARQAARISSGNGRSAKNEENGGVFNWSGVDEGISCRCVDDSTKDSAQFQSLVVDRLELEDMECAINPK